MKNTEIIMNINNQLMNSILQPKLLFSKTMILAVCMLTFQMQGQVRFGGDVFVGDNATFYIQTGEVSFQTGTTQTKRTTNIGKIQTSNAVTFSSTGVTATQHIDGYVAAAKSGTFTLPVGDGIRYAPITFTDKTTEALAIAAFWGDNPETAVSDVLQGTLDAVSLEEFWEVSASDSGQLTLNWDASSDLSTLIDVTLSDLTIAAYDTTLEEWVQIPGTPTGTVSTGSIISEYEIDFSKYSHYTFGKAGFCSPIIGHSGITTAWNGSAWDNGVPTIRDKAVINHVFTGTLRCHSLELNADLTLEDTDLLEIVTGVTTSNGAKVIMSNKAALVQRDETATAPPLELSKETRAMFSKRYVYWGTPVAENFFTQLNGATAQEQSGTPDDEAFDLKYKYVSGVTTSAGGWQALTATTQGQGFITRVAPKAPYEDGVLGPKIDLVFDGTAGNGVVEVPVAALADYPFNARSHNLLGNPYPSAVDAAAFLRFNASKVDGVIYVWDSGGPSVSGAFAQSDYYAWTLAGDNSVAGFDVFDGVIPSGQGFKVRVIDYAADATIEFNNCMRLTTNASNNMYRVDGSLVNYSVENPDRFKLLMTDTTGIASSILVTFDAQYTAGYDTMYDAYALSSGAAMLYGLMAPNNARLAINALPSFQVNDVVPVGVRKTGTEVQQFTFQMMQPEGIFANGQVVYLFDALTGEFHNLTEASTTIALNETVTNGRFQLVFQGPLSSPVFSDGSMHFVSWFKDANIYLSSSEILTKVEIIDLTGRKILEHQIPNAKETHFSFLHPQTAYFIKATTYEGVVFTEKIIANP
jgi:hypothetical protein